MPYFSACFSGPVLDEHIQLEPATEWLSDLNAQVTSAPMQLALKAPSLQLAKTFCHMVANGQEVSCEEVDPLDHPPIGGGELDYGIDIALDYDGMPVQYRDSPLINALCRSLPPLNEHALFAQEFTEALTAAGYGPVQIEAALSLLDGRADPELTAAGHSTERQNWDQPRLLQEALSEVLWLYALVQVPEYDFCYLETQGRYPQTLCWYQGQLFCCEAEPMLEQIADWHQNVLELEEDSMLARVLRKREPVLPGKLEPVSVCPQAWQQYQADQNDSLVEMELELLMASAG